MLTRHLLDTPTAHFEHTSTRLSDGSILATGGYGVDAEPHALCARWSAKSGGWRGSWQAAAPLSGPSYRHTATLLPSGRVLVVGIDASVGRAAIYDPDGDAWQPVAIPEVPRIGHAAALLPDGRVLIAGGRAIDDLLDAEGDDQRQVASLKRTEIFDPTTASWSDGPDMVQGRRKFALLTLADGSLFAVGGKGLTPAGGRRRLKTAERFDPIAQTWSKARSTDTAESHLVVLPNGKVLGHDGHLYDPDSDDWQDVEPGFSGGGPMAVLSDGRVVCVGQRGDEVFDPATAQWTPVGEPRRLVQRGAHLHVVDDEQLFLVGGSTGRRKGLPFSAIIDVDLDPDAMLPPESADEASGAAELLQMLVDNDKLELEEGHSVAELVPRVDRILRFCSTPGGKAAAMSRYLVDAEPVYDLYMVDRDLRKLLQQW